MKIIYLILLLCGLSFGQSFSQRLFTATEDTLTSTTSQDTLDWRVRADGTSAPAWIPVTDYITAAEKAAGTTLVYVLAGETGWTHGDILDLRIRGTGAKNSVTANGVRISGFNGAVTAFITPDTSASVTYYGASWITGN